MIQLRIRIIVRDAGFEPGTSEPHAPPTPDSKLATRTFPAVSNSPFKRLGGVGTMPGFKHPFHQLQHPSLCPITEEE